MLLRALLLSLGLVWVGWIFLQIHMFRSVDQSLYLTGRMPWIILHIWGFLCLKDAVCRGNKITELQNDSFCSYFWRVTTVKWCYETKTIHKLNTTVWYSVVRMRLNASSTFRLVYWTKILFCPTKMVSWWGHLSFQEKKIICSPAIMDNGWVGKFV